MDSAIERTQISSSSNYSMSDLQEDFKIHLANWYRPGSRQYMEVAITRYLEFFDGSLPISDVTSANIEAWQRFLRDGDGRKRKGVANTTINNYTRSMKTLINKAILNEWYDGWNPFTATKTLKEDHRVIKILNHDDTDRLFELASTMEGYKGRSDSNNLSYALWLGLYAGFRLQEI